MKVMSNMKQTCKILVLMRHPFPHLRQIWWMMTHWQHRMLRCRHHKCQDMSLQITMAQCLRRITKKTTILLWNTLTP